MVHPRLPYSAVFPKPTYLEQPKHQSIINGAPPHPTASVESTEEYGDYGCGFSSDDDVSLSHPWFSSERDCWYARAWQGSGEESGRIDRVPSHFTFTLTVSGKESNSVKSRPTSLSAAYGVYSSFVSNTCSLVTTARHLEGGNGPRGTWSTQPLKDLQALSWPLYAAFYSLGILYFTCGVFHMFLMYIHSVYFKTLTKSLSLMIFFWNI